MIILGLGSNIGDRLQHLRQALSAIKQLPEMSVIQVSPVYLSDAQLPDNAPADWNKHFLNCALRCESTQSPHELLKLLQKIEIDLGRNASRETWSPRVIDIDILSWNDEVISSPELAIPHPHLLSRPFALWPLADIAPSWRHPVSSLTAEQLIEEWGSRFSNDAPFHTRQIQQRIDTPRLVGIVNVTPDSFSDGGLFSSAEQALHQAIHLVEAGAEVLDIGAESTNPKSRHITTDEEWQRLQPVLLSIMDARKHFLINTQISVDTMHAVTAEKALTLGVDWINDVTGFQDADMRRVVSQSTADCVVMHHICIPPERSKVLPRDQDPTDFLINWSRERIALLAKDGIQPERIIIDPGIGFGTTYGQAISLVRNMEKFKELGVRILVGHSRKLFLTTFTHHASAERDIETTAITMHLARQPIDYIRVHNVEMSSRAIKVDAALKA